MTEDVNRPSEIAEEMAANNSRKKKFVKVAKTAGVVAGATAAAAAIPIGKTAIGVGALGLGSVVAGGAVVHRIDDKLDELSSNIAHAFDDVGTGMLGQGSSSQQVEQSLQAQKQSKAQEAQERGGNISTTAQRSNMLQQQVGMRTMLAGTRRQIDTSNIIGPDEYDPEFMM